MDEIKLTALPFSCDTDSALFVLDGVDSVANCYNCAIEGTADLTFAAGSPMSLMHMGKTPDQIAGDDQVKMFVEAMAREISYGTKHQAMEKEPTFDEVPAYVEKGCEAGKTRIEAAMGATFGLSVSNIKVTSVKLFTPSGELIRDYGALGAASAAGGWTCAFCDSPNSGNFCTSCGAPRQ